MNKRFFHESGILDWLNSEFPLFISSLGQEQLEKRAEEVIEVFDGYFTPEYMKISENAQYLKESIEEIRKAYRERDYKEMGKTLEMFKSAVEWM